MYREKQLPVIEPGQMEEKTELHPKKKKKEEQRERERTLKMPNTIISSKWIRNPQSFIKKKKKGQSQTSQFSKQNKTLF